MYIIVAVVIVALIAGFFVLNSGKTGYVVKQTGDNIRGSVNAKVTIIEYSDFQCPFCGKAEPTIKQVLAAYPDDVKFVYRHFPLPSHSEAVKAAEASECAAQQGMFWEYHDKLFENQKSLYVPMLKDYAKQMGFNTTDFNACLDSGAMYSKVQANLKEGQAAGVTGTPAFFVNGKLISGAQPFSVFDSAIKTELAK
ncbi:MAG: DsbA family protein [Candidatus Aenigmatarchaeota archaeon]